MIKPYSKYKPSGVEWIGDIPEHWEVVTIGRLCSLGRGRVISHEEIGENIGEYPVYSSQTENQGIMGYINTYDFDGDYVTWTTDGANAGTVFFRTGKFNCTNVCGTMKPKNGRVFLPLLPYILNLGTRYSVRYDINPKLMNGVMSRIPVCLPLIPEQQAIANFLDVKTRRIDTLIEKKQRLIELLKEQRTVIINQAVTRGINPNAKMKNSWIEWIGEIPEHWGLKKLKFHDEVIMGQSPDSENYNKDRIGLPFLQGNADFGNKHPIPSVWCETASKSAIEGDVLLSVRAPIGAINVADQEYGIGRGLCAIRPTESNKTYLYHLACCLKSQLNSIGTGSTYTAISVDDVRNLKLPIPPLPEQQVIATYLDDKTKVVDNSIEIAEKHIALLQEYRTALISEVVTGKIDVRDYVSGKSN